MRAEIARTCVGKRPRWVVRRHGVPSPARHGNTEVLDVGRGGGEVDAVDEWRDGVVDLLDEAVRKQIKY